MPLTEEGVVAALRQTWQPVANSASLPAGGVRGAKLLETELVVARFPDGRLLAADADCPHKGARLSAGCIRDGELMCAYHGWRFDSAEFLPFGSHRSWNRAPRSSSSPTCANTP